MKFTGSLPAPLRVRFLSRLMGGFLEHLVGRLLGRLLGCSLAFAPVAALLPTPSFAQQAQQVQRAPLTKTPAAIAQVGPIPTVAPTPTTTTIGPVTVAANAGWVATGVRLQKGGQLQVLVRDGRWSTVAKPANLTAVVRDVLTGAEGYPNSAAQGTQLASVNRGALIGRIGNGAPFLLGARFAGPIPADGELFVSINDAANELRDNQGGLILAIRADGPAPPARAPLTPPTRDPAPDTAKPPAQNPPAQNPATQPPTQAPGAKPPAREPRAQSPPPQDPTPPSTGPTDQDATLPHDDVAPTAPPDDAPPPEAQTPAPPMAAEPSPAVEPAAPPRPAIPVAPIAIGAAALAGLLLLGSLLRPRRKPGGDDRRQGGATPQVSTRIVNDGVSGQSLTITCKPERRS